MSEEVPKKGLGGVVINEGPDFRVEIQELDVPEPSKSQQPWSCPWKQIPSRRSNRSLLLGVSEEDDELLVRLNVTGLCMSDVHYMLNDWAVPPMSQFGVRCAGHEGAGVVVKVGAQVQKEWKVGDRVGIKPIMNVCHNCPSCWNGRMYSLVSISNRR